MEKFPLQLEIFQFKRCRPISDHPVVVHSCALQRSVGLPDIHSGYGFAIGNMAAFDVDNKEAVVSPGT